MVDPGASYNATSASRAAAAANARREQAILNSQLGPSQAGQGSYLPPELYNNMIPLPQGGRDTDPWQDAMGMAACLLDRELTEAVSGNERGVQPPQLQCNLHLSTFGFVTRMTPGGLILEPMPGALHAAVGSGSGSGSGGGQKYRPWYKEPGRVYGDLPSDWLTNPMRNQLGRTKAILYALFDKESGRFLKWGIADDHNTRGRFPSRYPGGWFDQRGNEYSGKPIVMRVVEVFENRRQAAGKEEWLVRRWAGPFNNEREWIGNNAINPTAQDAQELIRLLRRSNP